jgi:hypothetical protein
MRLVAWNCRSGFHRKFEALRALAPDVAIIAECCSLRLLARRAPELTATSAVWIGDDPNKGLGVFSFGPLRLVRDEAYDPSIRYVLPVHVDNCISGQTEFRRGWYSRRLDHNWPERSRAAHRRSGLSVAMRPLDMRVTLHCAAPA